MTKLGHRTCITDDLIDPKNCCRPSDPAEGICCARSRIAERCGIQQSMTESCDWKDNVIERFIWCIKNVWSRLQVWTCGSQARRLIADFIRYYNYVRNHGAVVRTPAEAHGLSNEISSAQRVLSSVSSNLPPCAEPTIMHFS